MRRSTQYVLLTFIVLGLAAPAWATVLLSENFDGGSVNSTFAYTNSGGAAPATNNVGGVNQNVAQLSYLSGGINNSIAFNAVNIPAVTSGQVLTLKYDFYNSGDAANTAAGGCCSSAADGAGIGLFPTGTYGLTGASNPSTGSPAFNWETPSVAGALTIGTAFFNTNKLNLNWNGTTLASADPGFSLKGDQWDRAIITLTPAGANTAVSVSMIQDINGTPIMFNNVLSGTATGLDIAAGLGTNFRLIAGERDGGAFHNGYLDNFSVTLAPEPGSFLLFGLGGVGLLVIARRRCKA